MLPQLTAQYPSLFGEELQTRITTLEAKKKANVSERKRAQLLNYIYEDTVL